MILASAGTSDAKTVAYIHGDIAANGTIPSGGSAPFHQMLLTDSGNLGCSQFKSMVEGEGYAITQLYDQAITLTAALLDRYDVVVFGLHQKVWSAAEQAALDTWIRGGGGILMYNDSAAGGSHSIVGIRNQTGQTAINAILADYGLQVAVDQGGGVRSYTSSSNSPNAVVWDQPVFEGEGVSPVAIDPAGHATALIPLDADHRLAGSNLSIDTRGVTISNPEWAVIAHCAVDRGNIIVLFDRQPMWNNGPGSDINEEDNREILRRIVRFLARDYGNSGEWLNLSLNRDLELVYRQWSGGTGTVGFDYVARNNRFPIQFKTNLLFGSWLTDSNRTLAISAVPEPGGETELTTVRLLPDPGGSVGLARALILPATAGVPLTVDAGMDTFASDAGAAWLEGSVSGAATSAWTRLSGPGTVSFADASNPVTTASFGAPGTYRLSLTASDGMTQVSDTLIVRVHVAGDIVHAINCGQTGSPYSAVNGIEYAVDNYFIGGGADTFPGNEVSRTGDDLLYNYARSKNSTFTGYAIPVANGTYTVHLQFAETFFTGNQRVFDTFIEGALVIDDLNLAAVAGKWVAHDRTFSLTVSDGTLNIDFTASANNPLLNAIVVVRD